MSLYLGENLISGVATPIQGARNIGQIIQSTIPLSDAGLHLLDGSVISGSGSYADFVTYIAGLVSTYPNLFISENDWQTSVTNYGVCGKFVFNTTNRTVRLPKITGFVEGTTDLTALGDLIKAGLPNITGSLRFSDTGFPTATYDPVGAFGKEDTPTNGYFNLSKDTTTRFTTLTFNASNSNSIYGRSSTVQPQTIKVLYYIVIATSAKTDIEVDIDEIATDLNGKADTDLSNCTKPYITETYVNGTSWYRVYSDGWCEQGGMAASGSSSVVFLKHFANTNYYFNANLTNGGAGTTEHIISSNYTTTGCTLKEGQYNTPARALTNTAKWLACGYIA